jgi:hypothetical protein
MSGKQKHQPRGRFRPSPSGDERSRTLEVDQKQRLRAAMKKGDSLHTMTLIRSQKTGLILPQHGTFVRDIENLGRKLILVNFGSAGQEYLFPNEVRADIKASDKEKEIAGRIEFERSQR